MSFVKDLYRDEIRSGWFVSSDIKKAWDKMLEMWQEIDRICQRYKITYWAGYGTLIGAARHNGFIPWDTDMDLCIMRPEYNRFCDAVERELIQEGGLFEIVHKKFNNFRISLSTTTMLGKNDLHEIDTNRPHGMMIEAFPLDVALDGTPEGDDATFKIFELLFSIANENYNTLSERVKNGQQIYNDWEIIEHFHVLSEKARQDFYNNYSELLFGKSSAVACIESSLRNAKKYPMPKEWFRDTVYLPFETVELPVPIDYEKFLTNHYGDWHKFVYDKTFRMGSIYSPDIPYREFFKRVDLEFMFPPEDTP